MNLVTLTHGEESLEVLTTESDIELILESFLNDKLILEFYSDKEEFIRNLDYSITEVKKKLWLITTVVGGWDTYYSAVYCAYTDFEAVQMSIEKMSHIYNPGEYDNNKAVEIGIANEELEIGEVCSSFNAG